jgi:hypothetical protein
VLPIAKVGFTPWWGYLTAGESVRGENQRGATHGRSKSILLRPA